VIGENIAALLGLVVALVSIIVSVLTGDPLWDAIGTLVIGLLLIVVAVFVAIEIKAMLIGQSMDPRRQAQMRAFLENRPEVGRVISLITLQLGSEVMVSVQAEMSERQTVRHLAEEINTVERALKEAFPEVRWSFFEPEAKADLTL
jgi:divalent metal cation (Fe/Co/Zn/Cd) transporter